MNHLQHPAGESAIECRGLTKDYGSGHGIFDLDLRIQSGECFGFVGPNGSGKTTTIRLLMDLVRPTRGEASIFGLDTHHHAHELKARIGYLPGELPQFQGMSAAHVVGLMAGLRGEVSEERIHRLSERLDLDLSRKYRDLSHGQKQKVMLVQAFMHQPDVLILDEPTLGLDPLMQREVRDLITESTQAGATVLLSSHVLSEVEAVCHRIGLVREGRLVRLGTLEELRTIRTHRIEALMHEPGDFTTVRSVPGVDDAAFDGVRVSCSVHGSIRPLVEWLDQHGVEELDSRELSLEEVFFSEYQGAG